MGKRAQKTFLGWGRGRTKAGDETGLWHALVTTPQVNGGHAIVFAGCGPSTPVAGQIEPLPKDAQVCQRIGCNRHLLPERVAAMLGPQEIEPTEANARLIFPAVSWAAALTDGSGGGRFAKNGWRFARWEEAESSARATFTRWMGATDWQVQATDEPVNAVWSADEYRAVSLQVTP